MSALPRPSQKGVALAVVFGLLAAGWAAAAVRGEHEAWRSRDAVSAVCVVESKQLASSRGRHQPELVYGFTVEGVQQRSAGYSNAPRAMTREQAQAILDRYEPGQEVPCFRHPDHPGTAYLELDPRAGNLVRFSLGVGVLAMLSLVFLRSAVRRRRTPRPS